MKNLRYIFFPLLLLCLSGLVFSPSLYGQNASQKLPVLLSGSIVDSVSLEAVGFANVSVTPLDGEKQEVYRQVSDDLGRFHIALPEASRYQVETSFVGKRSTPIIIERAKIRKGITLRFQMTDDVTELQGVTVSAARALVRLAPDRIAYDVANDPMVKSENLRDMLRKVPLVTVDADGNVQIKGSGNYQIHLNGKPSSMISSNPKEVLRSIPASSIKKIEVITEPGVKYDAEGTSAILNIITENNHSLEGLMGTVHLTALYPWMVSPGLYLTAKVGKLGITGNYGHSSGISMPIITEMERTTDKLHTLNRAQADPTKVGVDYGSMTLSYDINPKNLITAEVDFMLYRTGQTTTSRGQEWRVSDLNTRTALSRDSIFNDVRDGSLDFDLNYQLSTDRENELLTLSYLYSYSPNNNGSDMEVTVLDPATEAPITTLRQRSSTRSAMNEHTVQLDYTRPFGEMHYIEGGVKYIYRLGYGDPTYETWDPATSSWLPKGIFGQADALSSSRMDYRQGILGAYASYRWSLEKWNVQTGLRAEYGNYKVIYQKADVKDVYHTFLDWVPQLTVNYNPSASSQIRAAYMFKVRRPGIEQINPYKRQTSPYLVSYGNADLSNEHIHTWSLSYNFFTPKFVLNTSLSASLCNNAINSYLFADPTNAKLYHSTWGNIGTRTTTGLSAFMNYNPLAWLRIYSNINWNYTINDATGLKALDGVSDAGSKVKGWGGMIYMGSSITLPYKVALGLNGGFFRREPTLNQEGMSSYFSSFSLSKSFLKEKLNISVFVSNPIGATRITTSRMMGPNMTGSQKMTLSIFGAGVTVSYSFGELKSPIRKAQRNISNEDLIEESKQQGAGGQGMQGQGAH